MPYTINEIDEKDVEVQEDGVTLVQCGNRAQANLVMSALSLRDRTLKQLAHGIVQQFNDGDTSAKMGQIWRGTILGNGLTKDDADELWAILRTVLEDEKGPEQ